MKITCTQEEKEQLILTMAHSGQCPFAMSEGYKCVNGYCNSCIEKGIEWEIVNDPG